MLSALVQTGHFKFDFLLLYCISISQSLPMRNLTSNKTPFNIRVMLTEPITFTIMLKEISDNWYEDFFQGINCELWGNAIPPDVTKQEVDFLLRELNLQKGQKILDIPCGFGNLEKIYGMVKMKLKKKE